MMEAQVGIDRRRELPPFAGQTFRPVVQGRRGGLARIGANLRGQVVLFPDTFTNYNHPELGRAAVKVMEAHWATRWFSQR